MSGDGCASAWGCWEQPSHAIDEGPQLRMQWEVSASPSPDDLGGRSWPHERVRDRGCPLPILPINRLAGSFMLTLCHLHESGGSSGMYIPTCVLQICWFPHRPWTELEREEKQTKKQTDGKAKTQKHFLSAGCWLYLELCLVYVCIQSKFSEEYPAVISQRVWTNSLTAPLLEW